MKKVIILFLMICSFQTIHSQEVYFTAGKNFTTYDFINSSGSTNPNLKNGAGNFFELGYGKPSNRNDKFIYSFGFALNEYNSVGGNTANSYSWETQYVGLESGLSYSIIDDKDFDILPSIRINMSTIVSGRQSINGNYVDLTKEKEFSGLLATPSLGVKIKYNLSAYGFISLGYSYLKGFNLSNSTNQKLSFNTNQLQFGVHYAIK
jgi:hypothetical protein